MQGPVLWADPDLKVQVYGLGWQTDCEYVEQVCSGEQLRKNSPDMKVERVDDKGKRYEVVRVENKR